MTRTCPDPHWPPIGVRATLLAVTEDAKKVLNEALRLSSGDRAEVIDGLLASLETAAPGPDRSGEEWLAEIERRAREARAGAPGTPWPEVRRKIEDRLAGR